MNSFILLHHGSQMDSRTINNYVNHLVDMLHLDVYCDSLFVIVSSTVVDTAGSVGKEKEFMYK